MSIFDRNDRQMANMAEMMQRLGLDIAEVGQKRLGLTLESIVRSCQHCTAGEVCRDWLTRASPSLSAPPAFCPNAQRFEQLLAEDPPTATRH